MIWITVIWSMISASCLTLALVHALIWWRNREAKANAFFALLALAMSSAAICELWLMKAETIEGAGVLLRWIGVPFFVAIISLVAFVRLYLRTGRPWLAWMICGLRALTLILNFVFTPNVIYRQITTLRHVRFLGESISVPEGVMNPWTLVGQTSLLLLAVFVVDAMLTVWRRRDPWRIRLLSCAITFFILLGGTQTVLFVWGIVSKPLMPSLFFSSTVLAMGFELSWDVIRASQLSMDLSESESKLRGVFECSRDAIGIALRGSHVFANPAYLKLFGFESNEQIADTSILNHIAPSCRQQMLQNIERRVSGDPPPTFYETRGVKADGTEFDMEVSVSTFQLHGETYSIAAIRDVTARVIADQRLQKSREQLRALSVRLQSLREEERTHLAREIHDHLGQLLTALGLDLRLVERRTGDVADAELRASLQSKIASSRQLASETITAVQKIASELRPAILDRVGLEAAIENEGRTFQSRTGVQCDCRLPADPLALTRDQTTAVFRIFQETLTNIARHAHASHVSVRLHPENGALLLVVADDGVGINEADLERPQSLGLLGMQERAKILGGHIQFIRNPTQGTTVTLRLPLAARAQA